MRYTARAVASIAALVACSDSPTAPPDRPSLAAATLTENIIVPLDIAVFIPCADGGNGELVQLSGNLHLLNHITVNDNGFHIKSHAQPQGISGLGLTTGDKYQGTGVSQDNFNLGPGETYTLVNNFRIIGQGPGNNLLVHGTLHYTINANGDLTVFFDKLSVGCK
jgi:hypothetical protein